MFASGDYIIHCDPDDWVEIDWLACLYNAATENSADLVWCDFTKYIDNQNEMYYSSTAKSTKEDALLKLITGPRYGSLWGNLVRREIAQNSGIIWPSWEYCEDLALVFQYTALAKKVLYVNKSLYYYRDNPRGICKAKDKTRIMEKTNAAINAILVELECSKSVGLYNKFKPYCLSEIFNVKTNVFQITNSNMRACRMWRKTPDHLNFFDIWISNMSIRKKINTSLICLYIYPLYKGLVNLLFTIKK